MSNLKIAIAGNPNCGKTTVFNALTGAKQQVGNWPGVTVERVTGEYSHCDAVIDVTDLPGIYSFSALSPDEEVARKHILFDSPDVVVNVIDASNLERNLFLTTQLLEMDVPVVVALNMMDMAKQRGIRLEIEHLQEHIGCPVVPIVASKKKGMEELKKAICAISKTGHKPGVRVSYEKDIEKVLRTLEINLADVALTKKVSPRWLAIKLLEKDELACDLVGADTALLPDIEHALKKVERLVGEDTDMIIADGRYGFIHGLTLDVTKGSDRARKTFSDAVDKVVLNKFLGFPIFFLVMYLVFALTINVGGPFIDFFDGLTGTIFVDGFSVLLEKLAMPGWLVAILADGIGGGIQTVSTFIPPIFFIFLCLSFLEDSGYMARAAFVMDHFLRKIGLPGKAFIPMLVGFGCNVPGIMATRTLENQKDRILAIMMNPFMSCGGPFAGLYPICGRLLSQAGRVVDLRNLYDRYSAGGAHRFAVQKDHSQGRGFQFCNGAPSLSSPDVQWRDAPHLESTEIIHDQSRKNHSVAGCRSRLPEFHGNRRVLREQRFTEFAPERSKPLGDAHLPPHGDRG